MSLQSVVQSIALRHLCARIGLALVDMDRENKTASMQKVVDECSPELREGVLLFLTEEAGTDMGYRLSATVLEADAFNKCYNGLYRYVSVIGVAGVTVSTRCTIYPTICTMLTNAMACDNAQVVGRTVQTASLFA